MFMNSTACIMSQLLSEFAYIIAYLVDCFMMLTNWSRISTCCHDMGCENILLMIV